MGYETEQELETLYDDFKRIRDSGDKKQMNGDLVFSFILTQLESPLPQPSSVLQDLQPTATNTLLLTKDSYSSLQNI